MTPTEVTAVVRFTGILCAFGLLGALIGVAIVVETIRHHRPQTDAVSRYTIGVTVAAVIAIAYMLAGDTP